MNESLLYAAALLVIFVSAQIGSRSGAFAALSWMLGSLLSFLITLRCWFLVCRTVASYENAALPFLATGSFWLLFVVILFVFVNQRAHHVHEFQAITTSLPGRVLGAIFGTVTGAAFASAFLLTASLLLPDSFSKNPPGALPIAPDALAAQAFRFLERNLAGVDGNDPAHTLLPKGSHAGQTPATFWQ